MLPFEFIVDSPPVSDQTRYESRLHAWQDTVRAAATASWPASTEPVQQQLGITVTYYYEGIPVRIENDNLLKPIQTALCGCVYADNAQISDSQAYKVDLYGSFRVRDMSPVLAAAFGRGKEFLHIRIDIAPYHKESKQ